MATVLIRISEEPTSPDEVTVEQYVHDYQFTPDTKDEDLPPALLLAALILQNVKYVNGGTNVPPEEGIEVPGRGRNLLDSPLLNPPEEK